MEVLDEPLYGNFLKVTGVERPYRDELLSKMVRHNRDHLSSFFFLNKNKMWSCRMQFTFQPMLYVVLLS